jgi:hypothetical protein
MDGRTKSHKTSPYDVPICNIILIHLEPSFVLDGVCFCLITVLTVTQI